MWSTRHRRSHSICLVTGCLTHLRIIETSSNTNINITLGFKLASSRGKNNLGKKHCQAPTCCKETGSQVLYQSNPSIRVIQTSSDTKRKRALLRYSRLTIPKENKNPIMGMRLASGEQFNKNICKFEEFGRGILTVPTNDVRCRWQSTVIMQERHSKTCCTNQVDLNSFSLGRSHLSSIN